MGKVIEKLIEGYHNFQKKYVEEDNSFMTNLASRGQKPKTMVVACCDSRVDPALLLQCDPGDLFVVRNMANIVPPYENDARRHGVSAALEFGICYLNVTDLVILGHSSCGGIGALLNSDKLKQNDFISNWVSLIDIKVNTKNVDSCAQKSLLNSHKNCLTFPWIKERVDNNQLNIHLWFFDIKSAQVTAYSENKKEFEAL
ncbi:MAG: carbonic anhydrase [Gammaproteobacteria bacterium]